MSHTAPTPAGSTRVLIVGGSVVGASAALFLAARGVTPILIEKHLEVSSRPRAKLFYPRTMEAYRAVGAADDVYAVQRARPPADHAAVVSSLAGPELRRWPLPAAQDFSAVSPAPSALVKQADLERVVRDHAGRAGADLRFGHRLDAFEAGPDRVVARVLDGEGRPYPIEADYLLAADGSRGGIRAGLGIGRAGPGTVAHVMEIGFAADLRATLAGRRLAFAFVDRPGGPFVSWTTAQDEGTITLRHDPATDPAAGYDHDRCRRIATEVLGRPVDRITHTRTWEMGGWVAESYRAGRVFLLGDAAHVTPPVGGFGANTGIQDAWNLAAKLVGVLRGHAYPRLLDDYESERLPVGRLTVAQALRRLGDRAPGHLADGPLLSEAAVALGYRYRLATPAAAPAADVADADVADADEPARWSGQPGTRLPHLPLTVGDEASSTLDLVRDDRHLLLTGPDGDRWRRAATALDPGREHLDLAELPVGAPATLGLGARGALLVRPDQVIAWRTPADPPTDGDAMGALRRALAGAHLRLG